MVDWGNRNPGRRGQGREDERKNKKERRKLSQTSGREDKSRKTIENFKMGGGRRRSQHSFSVVLLAEVRPVRLRRFPVEAYYVRTRVRF